jgi:outer membrane protein OmpA-like peptidoglycan-associated protein
MNRIDNPNTQGLKQIGLAISVALLAACAGSPRGPSAELVRLQSEVDRLQGDTRIAAHADDEIQKADRAVQYLIENERRMDRDRYTHEVYVADKLVQIAEAEGLGRYAEARGLELGRDRDRLTAEARALQLDRARAQADSAERTATEARFLAEQRRMEADAAREQTEDAREAAADARMMASQAQSDAETQRQLADQQRLVATDAANSAAQARVDAAIAQQKSAQMAAELDKVRDQLTDLQTTMTDRGLVVTLGDVLFAVDRAELTAGGQRSLDQLSAAIQSDPDVQLTIEGHTDSTGGRDYNLDLSQRRAAAVRTYLTSRGVDAARIQSTGLGPDYPVASNGTEAGRQQNRRVEVIVKNPVVTSVSQAD